MNNVPEKHRAVAHKWVDGAMVEYQPLATEGWIPTDQPVWDTLCEYRVAPTKPSINWDHVAVRWNYLAIDKDGTAYLYSMKPHVHDDLWCGGESMRRTDAFTSFKLGTCDWVDSLVVRPGFKGETNETN